MSDEKPVCHRDRYYSVHPEGTPRAEATRALWWTFIALIVVIAIALREGPTP